MGVVTDVERELAELWRSESAEDDAVVRACTHNLVIVCGDDDDDVALAIARISETTPGRALVIRAAASGTGLTSYVSAHCHRGPGGKQVCSEQITIEAAPGEAALVAGSILPLLVEEMPVHTWWRRGTFDDRPLLAALRALSDCLIVDSARFERPAAGLPELRRIAAADGWKGHAADLGWVRTDPWRDAVAALFDAPCMLGYLASIRRVHVAAGGAETDGDFTSAGAYLAGWLASRLGFTPGDRRGLFHRPRGGEVRVEFERDPALAPGELRSVRLETDGDLAFTVRRTAPERPFLVASVEAPESCPLPRTIRLPERDEAALLCDVLQEVARDPLFDAALDAATAHLLPRAS